MTDTCLMGKNDTAVPVYMCVCVIAYRWLSASCVRGTRRLGVTTAHQMSWLMSERRGDFSCSRGLWAPLSYVVQIWAAHHAEGGLLFIDVVFMRGRNWPWQRSAALVLFTTYTHVPGTFSHSCFNLRSVLLLKSSLVTGMGFWFEMVFWDLIPMSRIFHTMFTHNSEIGNLTLSDRDGSKRETLEQLNSNRKYKKWCWALWGEFIMNWELIMYVCIIMYCR